MIGTLISVLSMHCAFLQAVQSQQQAERDFALARLEQSRIMLAIRLKEHHGNNQEVIAEASDFVRNVYADVWPSLSVNKPEKSAAVSSNDMVKGPNFFVRMVSSSLAIAGSTFSLKSLGGVLGNTAAFAIGAVTLVQLSRLASGAHSPAVGNYPFRRINGKNSSRLGTSRGGSTVAHLDVSLAKG